MVFPNSALGYNKSNIRRDTKANLFGFTTPNNCKTLFSKVLSVSHNYYLEIMRFAITYYHAKEQGNTA